MFVCAIDIFRSSLRVVLSVNGPESMPILLEGEQFPRNVSPERVRTLLASWREFYGMDPEVVVFNSKPRIPKDLVDALDGGPWQLSWVDAKELRQAQVAWRNLRHDPRWLRAGLMAMLHSSPPLYRHEGEFSQMAALDWLYACQRKDIIHLEAQLWGEGRMMTCSNHVAPTCPECEPFPGELWEDSWVLEPAKAS